MKRFCTRVLLLTLCLTLLLGAQAQALKATTLAFGSRGTQVTQLQTMLKQLGFYSSTIDGKYGRGTETAVKAYQQSRGLTADGKAGLQTRARLEAETGASSTGTSSSASASTTVSNGTLIRGSSGSSVSQLQTALKNLGYYNGVIDGNFGSGTLSAVLAFQKASGLKADGKAGAQTQARLYSQSASGSASSSSSSSSTSSSATTFTRILASGSTGSDVISVQTRLKALGYYTGTVDGKYGSGTIAAVKAFQASNGLKVDGKTGSGTFAALFGSSAISSGSASSTASSTAGKLQSGDRGTAVKTMQTALKNLGYSISADGTYGPLTAAAVTTFQKQNGLAADGVAGEKTLSLLYSGSAKKYDASADTSSTGTSAQPSGTVSGPSGSSVQLLHWYNDVKPTLSNGNKLTVYDPATSLQWTLRVMSCGRHCDAEPLTATDTATMYKAFGGKIAWIAKPVYVKLPDGRWSLATTHDVAHESGSIKSNDFDGHLCVHFLRDMAECMEKDPNWGVTNQKAIRTAWKNLTGITID